MELSEATRLAITEFVAGPRRAQWVYADELHVYLRKSHRYVPTYDRMFKVIDIADITVTNPRQGTFKALLAFLQDEVCEEGVFVECVLSDILLGYLSRLNGKDLRWRYRPPNNFIWLKEPLEDAEI
jgi:hypothetical protein